MFKVTLNEIVENKKNVVERIVEESILYLDCKEYKDNTLNLFISCDASDSPYGEDISGMEYLMIAFSVYNKVIEQIPEVLLFLKEITFFEVMITYKIFAKSDMLEMLNFSAEKAKIRGIEEEVISSRYNELIKYI